MTGKRSLGGGTHRENMVSHMNERKGKRTTKLMSVFFFFKDCLKLWISTCKTGWESDLQENVYTVTLTGNKIYRKMLIHVGFLSGIFSPDRDDF